MERLRGHVWGFIKEFVCGVCVCVYVCAHASKRERGGLRNGSGISDHYVYLVNSSFWQT